jgi:acetolactate synthase-1/2/3 large subunit
MNGAESLIRSLVAAGVDHVFTNPGSTEMEIIKEFDAVPEFRPILGLFEGVCTGAADGYARMTGKPAATLLHVGPGLANGLANLHNAKRAYSPVVSIAGDYPSYHSSHDPLLSANLEGLATAISGWVRRASSPATVGQDAVDAVAAAHEGQVATLIVPQDATWGSDATPATPAPVKPPPSCCSTARAYRSAVSPPPTASSPRRVAG